MELGRLVRLPSGVGGVIDQNSFGCMWETSRIFWKIACYSLYNAYDIIIYFIN